MYLFILKINLIFSELVIVEKTLLITVLDFYYAIDYLWIIGLAYETIRHIAYAGILGTMIIHPNYIVCVLFEIVLCHMDILSISLS